MELFKNDLPDFLSVKAIRTVYRLEMTGAPPVGDVHDFPEIIYVRRGSNPILVDGHRVMLSEGQMMIYAPGTYHIGEVPTKSSLDIICFDCDSPNLLPLYNHAITLDHAQKGALNSIVQDALLLFERIPKNSEYRGMKTKSDATRYALHKLKNQLELFLIELASVEQSQKSRKNAQFDEICAYLQANVKTSLTLEAVASYAHIGVSTLTALFREHASCGMISYFNELKIKEAKRLIRESQMNFTEISESLGFSSIHYFSKFFKKHTGKTPSEYAKQKRNAQ